MSIVQKLHALQGERLEKQEHQYECHSCGDFFTSDNLKEVWRFESGEHDLLLLCFRCEKIKDWSRP